jgi:hypothetical protein
VYLSKALKDFLLRRMSPDLALCCQDLLGKLQLHSESGHVPRLTAWHRPSSSPARGHLHDAGRNGHVPARGDRHLVRIVFDDLVADEEIEYGFAEVVDVASAPIGAPAAIVTDTGPSMWPGRCARNSQPASVSQHRYWVER